MTKEESSQSHVGSCPNFFWNFAATLGIVSLLYIILFFVGGTWVLHNPFFNPSIILMILGGLYVMALLFFVCTLLILWIEGWIYLYETWHDRHLFLNLTHALLLLILFFPTACVLHCMRHRKNRNGNGLVKPRKE